MPMTDVDTDSETAVRELIAEVTSLLLGKLFEAPLLLARVAAFAIAGLGVVLSLWLDEWGWFSRAGSLIVLCGLILANWEYFSLTIGDMLEFAHPVVKRRLNDHGISTGEDNYRAEVEKQVRKELIDRFRPDYLSAELRIVTAGTAIWGFGDLIGAIA